MIVVVGEALVDLVISPDGSVEAALGGAPYNTARAAARLGVDVEFVGGLSVDRFGSLLRTRLDADGAATSFAESTEAPTTLAAAEINDDGAATYRFYLEGTSAALVGTEVAERAAASLGPADIFFTGGLALVLEPMATSVVGALDAVGPDVVVVIDVNCRAAVIPDRDAYVERVERVIGRADIVKVSDEDLAYLLPTLDTAAAAQRVLDTGAQVVVVTAGSSHTTIVTAAGERIVKVPDVTGRIVDTIGAGDTFGAGLLAWWSAARAGRDEMSLDSLVAAVRVGHAAAGVVVTRRGADPPRRDDLAVEWP